MVNSHSCGKHLKTIIFFTNLNQTFRRPQQQPTKWILTHSCTPKLKNALPHPYHAWQRLQLQPGGKVSVLYKCIQLSMYTFQGSIMEQIYLCQITDFGLIYLEMKSFTSYSFLEHKCKWLLQSRAPRRAMKCQWNKEYLKDCQTCGVLFPWTFIYDFPWIAKLWSHFCFFQFSTSPSWQK